MAVMNKLPQTQSAKKEQSTSFQVNGMEVTLTPSVVRNYLVSGDKERVTMQEVAMFINLCKFSGLNPWLKEAYCIKYGSEPATMVVGKEAFTKRAEANQTYDGQQSGIIVASDDTGIVEHRTGTFYLPGEKIVGGWAEVFRKDRKYSTRVEVSFDEYAGRKKDGSLNGQWSKKPATMIRKVAQVQALREAFPGNLAGLYTAEEQGQEEPVEFVADIPAEQPQEPEKQPEPAPQDIAAALFGGEQNC